MREIAEVLDGHLLAPEDIQRVLARPDPDLRELGDEPLGQISGEGSSSTRAKEIEDSLWDVLKTRVALLAPRLLLTTGYQKIGKSQLVGETY